MRLLESTGEHEENRRRAELLRLQEGEHKENRRQAEQARLLNFSGEHKENRCRSWGVLSTS